MTLKLRRSRRVSWAMFVAAVTLLFSSHCGVFDERVVLAEALCFRTGRPGDKLPAYIDPATGNISCLPGFLCNEFDVNNATTYPEYCVPDPECQVTRLFGGTCDNRQGTYEPEICPKGYYCPVNTGAKIECPSNTFCPVGSTEPLPCPSLSICSGHQITYLPAVIALGVLSVGLVLGICFYRRLSLSSTLTTDAGEENASSDESMKQSSSFREVSDQQLVEGFRRSRANRPPLRLEFSNLAVSVEDKSTGKEKSILKDMSGFMVPGTVTAIMGPSGAGKTTFMMALLGKKDSAWKTEGKLLVNGEDNLSKIRHSIGFVPQDDVLHNELSVYKNLYYSSETRLPSSWTSGQKAAFRSSVIESLGLTQQRDIIIGDDRERGVSGGQRKRASIGVELTAAPLAMFLDEPTSGLDSTTSLEVCTTLKKIAVETDLTVGMVIHQPRVEIWNGLDQVLFIGKGGRVVYQGSQADAQTYFETKCGVQFPLKANPADVIIDAMDQQDSDNLADLWKAHIESTSPTLGKGSTITFDAVPEPFGQSDSGFRGAGFFKQVFLSHNRYLEKQAAALYALRVEMIVGVLCGCVLGRGFRGDNEYTGFYVQPYRRISIQPLTAIFPQLNMYAVMSIGLGAAPGGVRIFGLDRLNYFREVAAGANPVAYFLGTLVSSVYRCLYVSLLFSVGYHVVGGIPIGFGHFFSAMFLVYWNAYAVGMVVSMFVSMRLAPLVAQVVVICAAMCNGFVPYPHFLKLIAFPFYASQVLMNQWHELYKHVYEPQFEEWGYSGDRESESLGIMFVISMVVQAIALILMVVLDRDKTGLTFQPFFQSQQHNSGTTESSSSPSLSSGRRTRAVVPKEKPQQKPAAAKTSLHPSGGAPRSSGGDEKEVSSLEIGLLAHVPEVAQQSADRAETPSLGTAPTAFTGSRHFTTSGGVLRKTPHEGLSRKDRSILAQNNPLL